MRSWIHKPFIMASGLVLLAHGAIQAEVITDGSMGAATNLGGPNFQIDANLGTQAGENLFHSFTQFPTATGEPATFNGPASINNIISRVTGGSASQIDGTLASTISGADLYLINPQGVLFGKDAQIDVPGSLYVSTAEQIGFVDGAVFSTNPNSADMLTVAAPSSFGFLTPSPATIQIHAENLAAASGERLNFIGGDIDISIEAAGQPGINANSGGINLVSSGGGNQVNLIGGRPDLGSQTGGDISLSGHAQVKVNTFSDRDAGNLFIQADTLSLSGQAVVESSALGSTGDAGNIVIQTKTLTLSGEAHLNTSTANASDAGLIDITTDQLHLTDNTFLGSNSLTESIGDTGSLHIRAKEMALSGNAEIFTRTVGSGGTGIIKIKAERIDLSGRTLISSLTLHSKRFGGIGLEASQSIRLTESATIGIPKFDSEARNNEDVSGGNITITTPYLSIIGQGDTDGDVGVDSAWIMVNALSDSNVSPGTITIHSDRIHMANGAAISARSLGSGSAGNIDISGSDSLSLHNASLLIDSPSANGGNIHLSGFKQIDLQDSRIAALAGVGDGGNVNINTQLVVLDSSRISADSGGASGGRLDIQSTLVRTPDSTTTARGAAQAQDGEVFISDEINPDQALLDLELSFLAGEVKAPCSEVNIT